MAVFCIRCIVEAEGVGVDWRLVEALLDTASHQFLALCLASGCRRHELLLGVRWHNQLRRGDITSMGL